MLDAMDRRRKHETKVRAPGWAALVALLALPLWLGIGPCVEPLRPMIFVHGGSGSGAQFESQAMRFTSNGYPQRYIRVLEYDSSSISDIMPEVLARLDDLVAELQAKTGAEQVDLLGHSLGTFVSQNYLASPERAANIAHYVNIDGRPADAPPGGVPTLALWAGAIDRDPAPEIVGAINLTVPDQEHIQVATSEESFLAMFEFFRGHPPLFGPRIRSQRWPSVAGRVTSFPENTGLDGATLEVWRVDGDTGERIGTHPKHVYEIGPDGDFGPFWVRKGAYLEFAVQREGETAIHYFYEPFIHDDHLVRLNVALGLAPFIESSENHTALTVIRFKEFWGDRGADNDVLAIDGTDVINPVTAPSGAVGTASSAFFLFDVGSDGVNHLTSVPFPFPFLGFLTGADLYIPTDPPQPVSVWTVPRGDVDGARVIHVPNLPSTEARVVVQLNDFEQ